MDYLIWNEIPTVLGNLVGGLAFTGLTLYATHVRTAPKRAQLRRAAPDGLICVRWSLIPLGLRPFCFWSQRMPRELRISIGQYSDKGRKETNQDFHGVLIPNEPLLEPEGHRHRAGRRDQQQQRQPGRQRVRRSRAF